MTTISTRPQKYTPEEHAAYVVIRTKIREELKLLVSQIRIIKLRRFEKRGEMPGLYALKGRVSALLCVYWWLRYGKPESASDELADELADERRWFSPHTANSFWHWRGFYMGEYLRR